jgi:hypothetical protein
VYSFIRFNVWLSHESHVLIFSTRTEGCRAQSWIKGVVNIDVMGPVEMSLSMLPKLEVNIHGQEAVYSLKGGGKALKCDKPLLDETRTYDVTGKLDKGLHKYPFSVYIPEYTPPSMTFSSGHVECAVEYHVTARLFGMETRQEFKLSGAPNRIKLHPILIEPTPFPIKSHLVMDEGLVVVAAKLDNTNVVKGSFVMLSLAVRNKTRYTIDKLRAEVFETIEWKGKRKTEKETVTLALVEKLQTSPFVKKDTDAYTYFDDKKNETVMDGLTTTQMNADLASHQSVITIPIPFNALNTFKGKILKVSHRMRILCHLENKSYSPSLEFPLHISERRALTHFADAAHMVKNMVMAIKPQGATETTEQVSSLPSGVVVASTTTTTTTTIITTTTTAEAPQGSPITAA